MYPITADLSSYVPGLFISGELHKVVGLTQCKLAYWDDLALAHPHGRPGQGRGSRRLYTLLDVARLRLIPGLREVGLSLQEIHRVLLNLSDLVGEPAPLAELEAVTDRHRVLIKRSDEQHLDPLARQHASRRPLADLLAETEEHVALAPHYGDDQDVVEVGSVGVFS